MDRSVCSLCGCWTGDDLHAEIIRLRAEVERLRADANRWQTIAALFNGHSPQMDGTSYWHMSGGRLPRAVSIEAAVDALAAKENG